MAEFIHNFTKGVMNKDLDERLVPNGYYRDALNLDIANSDGSNVGALQNVKGNISLRGQLGVPAGWTSNYIDSLTNPVCIGSIRHDMEEKIYWFIASDTASVIAEYDQSTGNISPILVDKNNILKFTKDYLITGINILDKFIFWTDDQTEPKKININKFKIGSTDFNTHTKVPKYIEGGLPYPYSNTLTGQPDFLEEDITVIKKSPLTAPTLNMAASPFGDDVPGTGIDPVSALVPDPGLGNATGNENFTYIRNTADPAIYQSLDTYGQYLANIDPNTGNVNYYQNSNIPSWNGYVTFTVNPIANVWVANQDTIKLSGTLDDGNEVFEYQIRIYITGIVNNQITGQIQSISSNILKSPGADGLAQIIQWDVILEEEDPMFEYIFPRFAYRWKYIDNEYSCYSPFSPVAFVGNEFKYVSSDGYNIGMTNNVRKLIVESLTWGSDEVEEVEILYKESHNTAIYSVDTINKKDYLGPGAVLPTVFEIKSEIIGAVVESNQLLRPWDNVPLLAKAQEIIGNRLIYGNYLQNYSVGTVKLNVNFTPQPHPGYLQGVDTVANADTRMPFPSLKSIRTYQAGVVFKDKYGRETPVFTSQDASVKIEVQNSDTLNRLSISPEGSAPDWASHYKFFVKETSNQYYNLALDRFYNAEDGNVWLSFPSSERNKLDEETYLILKKQHDNDVAVDNLVRYKVLSIANEAPDFVKTFEYISGSDTVTIVGGFIEDSLSLQFTINNANTSFADAIVAGSELEIVSGGTTDRYTIASKEGAGTGTAFTINITSPLGVDAGWLPVQGQTVLLNIYALREENKPEFEGRFFAKINRDFDFDTNIIATFAALDPEYGILAPYYTNGAKASSNSHPADGDFQNGAPGGFFMDPGEVGSVCSNCPEDFKALNENNIGGEWSAAFRGAFGNIRTFGRKNGVIFVGQDQLGAGRWDGYTGKKFVNDLRPGALVRIRMRNGDVTRPYRVAKVAKQGGYRGLGDCVSIFPGASACNNQSGDQANRKFGVAFEFNEDIEEPFVGNGSEAALGLILGYELVQEVVDDNNKTLTSTNPAIFETEPKEAIDLDLYYEASDAKAIATYNDTSQELRYFNCFAYGQGIESNRIRDDYNAFTIDKGPKVSAPLDEPYASERRGAGMIFSQIYNSTSGINRLNQFIQAEPITKDLNPIHGTIQKLHTRDTDAIVLCEDKCFRILANKDALFNADGNVNITGNRAVLGQAVPYSGEFGISKNPESFAAYGWRSYFSDKNRGAVIRLSRDGITNIAETGMADFFADNLRSSSSIIGSYDDDKDLYNLSLDNLSSSWRNTLSESQAYQLNPDCNTDSSDPITQTTVSFKEAVKGWTSRKSFIKESGVTLNNIYYTFKQGLLWEHGLNVLANNFYGVQYDSAFNVLLNEQPQIVKGFSTLNYTGTQSRFFEYEYNNKWYSIAEINANQTIPTASQQKRPGWFVNYVKTDLEGGEIKEFQKKEGKYFNYIKGLEVFNDCEVIGEGIGIGDVDSDPQNYYLTTTISKDCSSEGGSTPDTRQYFWHIWKNVKPFRTTDIIAEPTSQSAKCAIELFFDNLQQNYNGVSNQGLSMHYLFSDGLVVGTQMYNSQTLQPITQAGTYLFVDYDTDTSYVPNSASLDANNAAAVPNSYRIIILNSSGQITEFTQYNTLASCTPPSPDMSKKGTGAFFSAGVTGFTFSIPFKTSQEVVCGVIDFMQNWSNVDPAVRTQSISAPEFWWFGPGNVAIGTQCYSKHPSTGVFTKKNYNVQGTPGYATKEVYRIDQPYGAMPWGWGNYYPTSSLNDNYVIITMSNEGIVTNIETYNTISTTCP